MIFALPFWVFVVLGFRTILLDLFDVINIAAKIIIDIEMFFFIVSLHHALKSKNMHAKNLVLK